MRKLIWAVLILAALYGGYWYIGQRTVERQLTAWFAARQAEGWVAEYESLNTTGFPSRFDTTITAPELADPETGLAWSAPFFQILALSYRPNQVIVAFPHTQTVASPYETVGVDSERMRGSLAFDPGPALALDRATFVIDALSLEGQTGWSARMDQARFAVRRMPASETSYEIGLETDGLVPPDSLRETLDPTGGLPARIEKLHLDAEIGFDRPWDLDAIDVARPQPVTIDLADLSAAWGELRLRAAGALEVDTEGMPTGKITVKAVNWREMLKIAVAAGAVPQGLSGAIESGLGLLAGMSGDPDTLDAPLSFGDGRVSFGPIPLGPAPRLLLR